MASKKRSVLFEKTFAKVGSNNGETSEPEPSSRSGIYPATQREEPQKAADSRGPNGPLEGEALEALVSAHVLSRL